MILVGLNFFIEDLVAILMERGHRFKVAFLSEGIEIDIEIIEGEAAEGLIGRMAIAERI